MHTINIELANGTEGYIPPPEQHVLGGYTTWPARSAGLDIQAEPRIVASLLTLLEGVAGKPRRPVKEVHGAYAKAVLASNPLTYWRGGDFSGPTAGDATGHGNVAMYEDGVVFYLDGPKSPAFSGSKINRAPHFAGGRMKAILRGLPSAYSVEMWVYNGFPVDVRSVTGYFFARGGDQLGISGTAGARGRILLRCGDLVQEGTREIPRRTWAYIALVRDRRQVSVYLDGRREISADVAPGSGGDQVFIGGRADGTANFEGKIDEVAIYSRRLASNEIFARYRLARIAPAELTSTSR